jgi:hypothetical protein
MVSLNNFWFILVLAFIFISGKVENSSAEKPKIL